MKPVSRVCVFFFRYKEDREARGLCCLEVLQVNNLVSNPSLTGLYAQYDVVVVVVFFDWSVWSTV